MDTLMTLLANAGLTFMMGVPGADDIMLNYQSTSFHDILYLRKLLGLKAAPEFEKWLKTMTLMDRNGQIQPVTQSHSMLQCLPKSLLAAAS
jgi:ethanolamine ammonia-lyase large subunit